MHLFITDFEKKEDQIIIQEDRVVKHMGRVLRMKRAESFKLQAISFNIWEKILRYTVEIVEINKQQVVGRILSCKKDVQNLSKKSKIGLCVALPNTWTKLSLITQKLTEIGIDEIFFWKAERSQMKWLNEQKIEKLQKLALEASEQSQRWNVPLIKYMKNIRDILGECDGGVVVFDIDDRWSQIKKYKVRRKKDNIKTSILASFQRGVMFGIIWPEGGLSEEDYEKFGDGYIVKDLGYTILRMETAAIVGGWRLKNEGWRVRD